MQKCISQSQMQCIRHTRYALYDGIQGTWKNNGKMEQISSLKIRKQQYQEPNSKNITEFAGDKTIVMNYPLFSHEALGEFNTKPEQHSRQWNTNSYVVNSEDGTDEKCVRTSQGEQKLENWQLCNRFHNSDLERSKVLAKQKLCYCCYESISPKHTARNC